MFALWFSIAAAHIRFPNEMREYIERQLYERNIRFQQTLRRITSSQYWNERWKKNILHNAQVSYSMLT